MNRVPVAVCFYRRPALLARVLQMVEAYRPPVLFGISDGPASDPAVAEARRIFQQAGKGKIPLECFFADHHLGLRQRVETGLDGVFAHVPFAIILEEDCLPEVGFFAFVEEMEAHWRNHPKVGGVSGNCFHPDPTRTPPGYFFSHYPHIWGWGTWAHQWQAIRRAQKAFPIARPAWPPAWPPLSVEEKTYWLDVFQRVRLGKLSTWDYPMLEASWDLGLRWITPAQNLVRNIGFGPEGTNTRDVRVDPGYRPDGRLTPWKHPENPVADPGWDRAIFDNHYRRMSGKRTLFEKIRDRWMRMIRP